MGLGNPGPRYELTRHNAGFLVVDNLAEKHRIKLSQQKNVSLCGQGEIEGCQVLIAKPSTYMNHSGKAAKALLKALNIRAERLIVVHDDIDLPLGKIRKKSSGGDGGQRGIRSIAETINTDRFHRIRIGIGRPENRDDVVDYVLSPFEKGDFRIFDDVIEQAIRMVELTLVELGTELNLKKE